MAKKRKINEIDALLLVRKRQERGNNEEKCFVFGFDLSDIY